MSPRRPSKTSAAAARARTPASPAAPRPAHTTTFRLWADQLRALQALAADRRWTRGGGGRADHSLTLRDVLDEIADTGRVSPDVRDALRRARDAARA